MRTALWIGALLIVLYLIIRVFFNIVGLALNILWIVGLLLLAWWIYGKISGRTGTGV